MTTTHDAPQPVNNQAGGMLVLVRHGESQWNALGKWTGQADIRLSEQGRHDARRMGELISDIKFDRCFTSNQIRTIETLAFVLDGAGIEQLPREQSAALNERDYGDYTGLNKWEVQQRVGDQTFHAIRRDWDHPVPNGETLKMVYERAVPYYEQRIRPHLQSGENVLLVSHGNTLRAMVKHLDNISDEQVANIEVPLGKILIYRVTLNGQSKNFETRQLTVGTSKA